MGAWVLTNLRGAAAQIGRRQPWSILGPLLVVQWLALVIFALSAEHNGWLYYQGGDQSFYWTDAHQLSQWTLPVALVGYAWSYLLIPVAFFAGSNVLSGLPAVIVLNALLLLPAALLCVYGIATRIAGRLFGYWAAALWVLIPYAAIPMFDQRYHQKFVSITLPQSLGLTVLGDFPSTVFMLVTAWLLVRSLDTHDWADAALAGIVGGFMIGVKPSTGLFFPAAVLCLLVARRWTQTAVFLGALVPGLLLLALWKQRGLGELPAFSSTGSGGSLAAIGADAPVGSLTSPFRRYVDLDWHQLQQNIDGVREFFWAVRPLEFVPLAGLLAIGRRSWPKSILVFGWFMTFLLIKGTDAKANIDDASFFRLLMPSFPAFLLLLASIPLLVPTFSWTRKVLPDPLPALPARRPGRPVLATAAAVLVVLPLIFVAGPTPQATPEAVTYRLQDVYVPVEGFGLNVRTVGGTQQLTWNKPSTGHSGTAVFYTILRSRPVATDPDNDERKTVEGLSCKERQGGAPLSCDVVMDHLSTTDRLRYIDRPPRGRWTYRVGMTANWVNDTSLGDVMLVSPPVTVSAGQG